VDEGSTSGTAPSTRRAARGTNWVVEQENKVLRLAAAHLSQSVDDGPIPGQFWSDGTGVAPGWSTSRSWDGGPGWRV